GENVTGKISLSLSRPAKQKQPTDWQWQTEIDWVSGEVFWQPFYFASGGHHFQASGKFGERILTIDKANLVLKDVGQANMSGRWLREGKRFEAITVDTGELDLARLYPLILKPLLEKTAYSNLEMAG